MDMDHQNDQETGGIVRKNWILKVAHTYQNIQKPMGLQRHLSLLIKTINHPYLQRGIRSKATERYKIFELLKHIPSKSRQIIMRVDQGQGVAYRDGTSNQT